MYAFNTADPLVLYDWSGVFSCLSTVKILLAHLILSIHSRRSTALLVLGLVLVVQLHTCCAQESVMDKDGDGVVTSEEFVEHAAAQVRFRVYVYSLSLFKAV